MKKKNVFLPIAIISINLVIGIGSLVGGRVTLSMAGVEVLSEKPKVSWQNIYDGTYQSEYSNYLEQNNFARDIFVKNYDSILHMFHASNNNITYGKNGYLYETGYISSYMNCNSQSNYNDYGYKLSAINYALSLNGKEFVYIISPSKAEIYDKYLPSATNFSEYSDRRTDHYLLKNALERFHVPYVDACLVMEEMKTENLPSFYKQGIHWSELAAIRTLDEALGGKIEYTYSVSSESADADRDLYDLANVWQKPLEEKFYRVNVIGNNEIANKNLLLIGTSFCGQWIHALRSSVPVFNTVTHYRYLQFMEKLKDDVYSNSQLSEAIDENHIKETIDNADIIVFETNASGTFDSHRAIVDYLYQVYVLDCGLQIPEMLLDFTSEGSSSTISSNGLYPQEPNGRWTTDEFSLTFIWDNKANINILIDGYTFQQNYQIHVFLNDKDYGYADILDNNTINILFFNKEDVNIGQNYLKLKMENTVSPSEISDSSDSRKLGIFLKQLLIRGEFN